MNFSIGEGNNRVPAYILIALGAFFLASQLFNFSMSALWPLFVILPGIPFLYGALTGGKKDSGLIFPGIIITGTGLMLLYQSITGHWESWAYVWTLYPVFVGMGLIYQGKNTNNQSEFKTGRGMVTYGLMALAALWVLFEVFIFGSIFGGLTGWLLPAAMIVAGWVLLNRNKSPEVTEPKAKNLDVEYKSKNGEGGVAINEELRRRIDEALAEDAKSA